MQAIDLDNPQDAFAHFDTLGNISLREVLGVQSPGYIFRLLHLPHGMNARVAAEISRLYISKRANLPAVFDDPSPLKRATRSAAQNKRI